MNCSLKDESQRQRKSSNNCVQLTMTSLHQKLKLQAKLSSVIFVKLETLKNEKIYELIAKSLKKFQEILEVLQKFKSKEITINLTVVFDEKLKLENLPFDDEKKVSVTHSWSQLTEDSQQELLESQIKFQGMEMKLKEAIEAIPLDNLVTRKEIEFPEVKMFVE
jgi:hypothetical protein